MKIHLSVISLLALLVILGCEDEGSVVTPEPEGLDAIISVVLNDSIVYPEIVINEYETLIVENTIVDNIKNYLWYTLQAESENPSDNRDILLIWPNTIYSYTSAHLTINSSSILGFIVPVFPPIIDSVDVPIHYILLDFGEQIEPAMIHISVENIDSIHIINLDPEINRLDLSSSLVDPLILPENVSESDWEVVLSVDSELPDTTNYVIIKKYVSQDGDIRWTTLILAKYGHVQSNYQQGYAELYKIGILQLQ